MKERTPHPDAWDPWKEIAKTTHNYIDYTIRRVERTSKNDRKRKEKLND